MYPPWNVTFGIPWGGLSFAHGQAEGADGLLWHSVRSSQNPSRLPGLGGLRVAQRYGIGASTSIKFRTHTFNIIAMGLFGVDLELERAPVPPMAR